MKIKKEVEIECSDLPQTFFHDVVEEDMAAGELYLCIRPHINPLTVCLTNGDRDLGWMDISQEYNDIFCDDPEHHADEIKQTVKALRDLADELEGLGK